MSIDRDEYQTAWRDLRRLASPERLMDFGVRCYVVKQDIEGGVSVIPGMAPVAPLRSFDIGGMWDTHLRRYVGPSVKPHIWYCADYAEELIRHPDSLPAKICIEAGFGAGKTHGILAAWLVARALEYAPMAGRNGIELLGTSPTDPRLEEFVEATAAKMRPEWFEFNRKSHMFRLHNGVRLRLLGTAKRSNAQGSRVQGFNSAAAGCDELQDNCEELENVYARGRRAPGGNYKMLATSTPKISTDWRNVKRRMQASGEWKFVRVDARTNVMVYPKFWEGLASLYSPEQFERCVRGMDVGPERATYPSFSGEINVKPIPRIGARDVTRSVVGASALLGHDPGASVDVTLMLKCYQIGRQLRQWFVVDEWTTKARPNQEHVFAVRAALRERWDLQWPESDMPKVLVRIDPMGDSDAKTPQGIYATWRHAGFTVKAAAYNRRGEGKGLIHKDAGIEMINRLLCDAAGTSKLFIACDERGEPAAPKLLEALEMSERDLADKAETEAKGSDKDLSHWAAALRYALWPYERLKPRVRRDDRRILL